MTPTVDGRNETRPAFPQESMVVVPPRHCDVVDDGLDGSSDNDNGELDVEKEMEDIIDAIPMLREGRHDSPEGEEDAGRGDNDDHSHNV
jgi:hypothetical protein